MSKFAVETVNIDTGNAVGVASNIAVDDICAHCKHPCKPTKHYSKAALAAFDSLCRHAEDFKLVASQKNVWSSAGTIPEPIIVFSPPGPEDTPKQVLAKTKEILENLPYPDRYALTPDTSEALNHLYKGPKFPNPDDFDDPREALNHLYKGPKIPKPPPPSEAQKIENSRIKRFQERNDETMKIRQLMFEQEQGKEVRKEAHVKGLTL